MGRLMKVKVDLTVVVDVDDWLLNYGTDDLAAIRSDVKSAVVDSANSGGVLASGIVGAYAGSLSKVDKLAVDVAYQRDWVANHGGDLAGYIARYGPADGDPARPVSAGGRYGLGGPAIYAADIAVLKDYEARLLAAGGKL